MSDNMIRVLIPGSRRDGWLSRAGDAVSLDVPGGRVTLELNGGWSRSGIAYTKLSYKPIRSGLVKFGCGPVQRRPEDAMSDPAAVLGDPGDWYLKP